MSNQPSRLLKTNLLITDLGFILYWLASSLSLFPEDWLFKDHNNPIVAAWNWSFAPIDLSASATGLLALWLARRGSPQWPHVALLSISLTFSAGLLAVSFWSLRSDFDWAWWAPNLYLVLWPVMCLCSLLPSQAPRAA